MGTLLEPGCHKLCKDVVWVPKTKNLRRPSHAHQENYIGFLVMEYREV